MRKLRTEKTAEVKEFRLRLEHLKTHKDHSTKLKSDIAEGQDKDSNYMSQINELQEQAKVPNKVGFVACAAIYSRMLCGCSCLVDTRCSLSDYCPEMPLLLWLSCCYIGFVGLKLQCTYTMLLCHVATAVWLGSRCNEPSKYCFASLGRLTRLVRLCLSGKKKGVLGQNA